MQPSLEEQLAKFKQQITPAIPIVASGRLVRVTGLTLEATGCHAVIGSRCQISTSDGSTVEAEVIGFANEKLILMPVGFGPHLKAGDKVTPLHHTVTIPAGPGLLGRTIDAQGVPIDNQGPLTACESIPLTSKPLNPLERMPINEPLDVGIRSINALLTVGRGQRLGLFAGTGVGKSVLLGMMTRFTRADIIIVALIGERGREIKEFIDNQLYPEGLSRSVVVAAASDTSPLMRFHGAWLAVRLAEYYRNQGHNVLLLMDSLTRLAQAQRELGLAVGEPPMTKGYPPSVFTKIAQLVERTGNGNQQGGSITSFYTILVEGDDHHEPISDAARAILDGHIVLSRELAEQGLYPAIEIGASISRLAQQITDSTHQQNALQFKRLYSAYQNHKDLINVDAYVTGSDQTVDQAIAMIRHFEQFLSQPMNERVTLAESQNQLAEIWSHLPPTHTAVGTSSQPATD